MNIDDTFAANKLMKNKLIYIIVNTNCLWTNEKTAKLKWFAGPLEWLL